MQASYSIKDLERLSGIKAHTIRIWEQRYQLFSPERGGRNIRSYTCDDLKKLLNISFLNDNGIKISEIALLTEAEVCEKIANIAFAGNKEVSLYANELIRSMIEANEFLFNKVIAEYSNSNGFESCVEELIFPFLRNVGVMWQTGEINPAQEHFLSNLIRQKIIAALDAEPPKDNAHAPMYVFYLPEGEWHEIGLLYYNYLAKRAGVRYLYLGQSVPYQDLATIVEVLKPHALVTILTTSLVEDSVENYLKKVTQLVPEGKLLVSGYQLMNKAIKPEASLAIFKAPSEFNQLLQY